MVTTAKLDRDHADHADRKAKLDRDLADHADRKVKLDRAPSVADQRQETSVETNLVAEESAARFFFEQQANHPSLQGDFKLPGAPTDLHPSEPSGNTILPVPPTDL